jgi:multidrug resistance efflux pump
MIIRKYVIPALAAAGVCFAAYTVRSENQHPSPAPPVSDPARSPYAQPVAASGIIEASTQNIAIGTQIAGVVAAVYVKEGDEVKAGAPLFMIDDRATRAEVEVRKAALAVADQNLERLRGLPRQEDVPPLEAKVAEARAQSADAQSQLTMWESVADTRAVSRDELNKRKYALDAARAREAAADSQLALLKAGTWKPDLSVAQSQVESARAQLRSIETDLDRLTVRAPSDGQVLQLNVRAGEFAPAGFLATPLILFGDVQTLVVRADVDENDAWRVRPDAPARASLRGNSDLKTELTFVRIEPYVVPKKSLTGDSSERVDTRVLQVLYSFKRGALPAYVGQQVDVFIDAGSGGTGKP